MNLYDFFRMLSEKHHLAILTFILYTVFFAKLYEHTLENFVRNNIKDFKSEEKNIPFNIFVTGVLQLIIGLILDIFVDYPFTWYLCTSFLIIGGLLGILPFSFTKKK